MADDGIDNVKRNIEEVFKRRKEASLSLCKKYALLAKQTLHANQGLAQDEGKFWTNQTTLAIKTVFGFTEDFGDSVCWGIAHHMEYGKWLELANNRKHAALEPTLKLLVPFFMDDVRKVFE
jgi:hypothetical protein